MSKKRKSHDADICAALDDLCNASDPSERLAATRRINLSAEALEISEIFKAREAGVSWSKIGAVYGLTKQGAQQRFRPAIEKTRASEKDEKTPDPE